MREANLQAFRNSPCPVVGSRVSMTVGPWKVSDRALGRQGLDPRESRLRKQEN